MRFVQEIAAVHREAAVGERLFEVDSAEDEQYRPRPRSGQVLQSRGTRYQS